MPVMPLEVANAFVSHTLLDGIAIGVVVGFVLGVKSALLLKRFIGKRKK